MSELPSAAEERARLAVRDPSEPLTVHLQHGLAYTVGSALGCTPPTREQCLAAFLIPNKAGLTAGARAWSKHFHRSQADGIKDTTSTNPGWWGTPKGPVALLNERALDLFWRVMNSASWRNLHWLPHQVLAYEARVPEGYGMRWSQDLSGIQQVDLQSVEGRESLKDRLWIFRGFVEPMVEGGHENGWRH
ncbi:hypothetical protein NEOLEDRAFT_1138645 [Neolentinus lepideus HHB14362 ss-1]|uniref:Uncharacterized protein n=1 Tax=Neolentinus lepideus HHB14362 ss-1 TaxID=1314782 RepID=A0A165Q4D0_9AGAM|nr:hypothetical protein NEOLEDRAFT_1138645 [Neolentinus lepideus HHB14362 ss-1]